MDDIKVEIDRSKIPSVRTAYAVEEVLDPLEDGMLRHHRRMAALEVWSELQHGPRKCKTFPLSG